jgi:hypothetical protein
MEGLLVCDHYAEVGDVLFDAGDLFVPGAQAFVGYSCGLLAFGFGECFEGVFELLLQRWAGHRWRVSPGTPPWVLKVCKVFETG